MMDLAQTVFDQVNLIVKDMDATMAFYSRLGLRIPPASTWPPGSQARHAEVACRRRTVRFDNYEMARSGARVDAACGSASSAGVFSCRKR
jgi:hypothetical protein